MAETRLILVNEQASPPELLDNCPTLSGISVPIDFQLFDVREPESGNGSYSYTIQIPGNADVNKFFENVYDVNSFLNKFNPNLKVKALYYVDGLLNFEGHLQIENISVDEVSKTWVYHCKILGEVITFLTKIKDKYLTGNVDSANDLNFSAYNHNLTFANITASWAALNGTGVKYPLVDWGTNNSNLLAVKPTDFRGVLHRREIAAKIFAKAGYKWTSTFLDSADFKKKVMPPTGLPVLSQTVLNNNKFLAVTTTPHSHNTPPVVVVTNIVIFQSFNNNVVDFQTETYDTGNIFTTPSLFTPPVTNKYNIQANLGLNFVVTRNSVDVSSNIVGLSGSININVYESNSATILGTYSMEASQISYAPGNQNNVTVILNNIFLTGGASKLLYITVNHGGSPGVQYTGATAGATWDLVTTVVNTSNFSAEFASNEVYEGAAVVVNDLLPTEYKMSDFLSDLRREFNLYFMPDKSDPTNIIIEDRPNFFLTTPRDWKDKHDKGSEVQIIPMGELDFIKLKFTHASDDDYFNKLYEGQYKAVYGSHIKDIDNDFIKNEKSISLGIAATPYALNVATGVVLPQIYTKDNLTVKPIKTKPRSLHWSGLITMPIGCAWKFVYNNGATTVTYNTMPHAGHTDNPWSPTQDLSFNVPDKVYFSYPNFIWTTNGLYNKYYSQYINQITDKNSKIVKTKFYLTSNDIHIFDFRYPIFTIINEEQGYYIVNKIEQYNPLISETTMVELLKLTDYAVFIPGQISTGGGGGGEDHNWSRVAGENITKGENNYNTGSQSILIGGSGNVISQTSDSVALFASNNANVSGVENFFGVGLSKTSSPVSNSANLFDSVKITSSGVEKFKQAYSEVDSDFTIDGTKTIYYINLNTFGFDISCSWDPAKHSGMTITFKIILNTSPPLDLILVNIGSPPGKVEGSVGSKIILSSYSDSVTVHSDGINLNIISNY